MRVQLLYFDGCPNWTVAEERLVQVLRTLGQDVTVEHPGAMTCGCAEDCWCQRRWLGLFRWAQPWRHRTSHPADGVALDPAHT